MKVRKTTKGHIIKLERGERVLEMLTGFCKEKGITSGLLHAIGAVKNAEIGYYDLEKREYFFKQYPDDMEVVSMTGNVALVDPVKSPSGDRGASEPFIHAHVVLSDTDNHCHGGHLKEAEVAVTVEVFLTDYGERIEREYDDSIGLKLLDI